MLQYSQPHVYQRRVCVCLIKRDCYYRTHAHICKYAFVCECTRLLSQETNAGNFVADLMRHAVDADIAILNSGTLRADAVLGPGLLRMKDLVALLPMQVGECVVFAMQRRVCSHERSSQGAACGWRAHNRSSRDWWYYGGGN